MRQGHPPGRAVTVCHPYVESAPAKFTQPINNQLPDLISQGKIDFMA